MSNTRTAHWWWGGGAPSSHHGRGGFVLGSGMPAAEIPAHAGFQRPVNQVTAEASPPYHQQGDRHYFGGQNQVSLSNKPRLRWTKELHEKFVSAVNDLGGANNATPKTIWNLMQVPEITLFQIKSHLQKYRLAKAVGRLTRRDGDGRRNAEEEMQNRPMDMQIGRTYNSHKYGNLNHFTETSVKNWEMPPIPTSGNHGNPHYTPNWYELLGGDNIMKPPVVSHPNSSVDGYRNSFGYSSRLNLSQSSTSYFDIVEKLLKIENELMKDDDDVAMGAPAQQNNNVNYLYRRF